MPAVDGADAATIRITVKLYASLDRWLPAGARNNAADVTVPTGTTPAAVLDSLGVPREHCHLVLVNGKYVAPGDRASYRLAEADAVAAWPPIAGG